MNDDLKQRLLVAFALAMTFMVIMQYVIPPEKKPVAAPPAGPVAADTEPGMSAAPASSPAASGPDTPDAAPVAADPEEMNDAVLVEPIIVVREGETPEESFEATFSTRGAALKRFRLLGYFQTPERNEGEEVVLVDEMARGRMSLVLDDVSGNDTRGSLFRLVSAPADAVLPEGVETPRNDENRLVFETVIDGWLVRKTYDFGIEPPYGLELLIEIVNRADAARKLSYRLTGPAGIVPDDESYFGIVEAVSAALVDEGAEDAEVERKPAPELVRIEKAKDRLDPRAHLAWTGVKNRFFATLLLAEKTGRPLAVELRPFSVDPAYLDAHDQWIPFFERLKVKLSEIADPGLLRQAIRQNPTLRAFFAGKNLDIDTLGADRLIELIENSPEYSGVEFFTYANAEPVLQVEETLAAGAGVADSYRLYGGPATDPVLLAFDNRLNNVVAYTWSTFSGLSRWLLWLLMKIAGVVGNYGVAMIILTLLVKSALHPLTRKALASGHKMQKVAPKMKELQKKFANDKAKLNQEMMRLYREEGVSPMGGCLPMLIQLPLFFALYGAFAKGFASRQAVFIPGWIDDLSMPDRLFQLPFTVPMVGWQYFNLLPMLYLVLQIIHMSMQPKSEDPQVQQQQKMMKIMPIMFVFIFYQMPAGLVLYFAVSSVYTIVEHWLIKRKLDPHEPSAAAAAVQSAPQAGAGVGIQGGKKGKKKK